MRVSVGGGGPHRVVQLALGKKLFVALRIVSAVVMVATGLALA